MANWSYVAYWAQGEYICILGDDDWYTPEFIGLRVNTFNKYQNIALVFSNYDNFIENELILAPCYNNEEILTGLGLIFHFFAASIKCY